MRSAGRVAKRAGLVLGLLIPSAGTILGIVSIVVGNATPGGILALGCPILLIRAVREYRREW